MSGIVALSRAGEHKHSKTTGISNMWQCMRVNKKTERRRERGREREGEEEREISHLTPILMSMTAGSSNSLSKSVISTYTVEHRSQGQHTKYPELMKACTHKFTYSTHTLTHTHSSSTVLCVGMMEWAVK